MSEEKNSWWPKKVLNRKKWGDLVTPALERLLRARDRGLLPHSLLMVGPVGLGRELAAVEAAAMLVCGDSESLWNKSPCAARVRRGVHPDVTAMIPTGKGRLIKIDPLRKKVIEVVSGRPYEGLRRVWIFDGVEEGHFNRSSANAFLKTLEEPPDHAYFILLAANPSAVLPTILSRCQQLILPGLLTVAKSVNGDSPLPELAESLVAGVDIENLRSTVRSALSQGLAGETRHLLRLPYTFPDALPKFSAVAAVALEMAAENQDEPEGEELARLAAELLAVEGRTRSLNLNERGQLVSSLMGWYRELRQC